jgi:hypothetical protein
LSSRVSASRRSCPGHKRRRRAAFELEGECVASLALGWPVKPGKAEATCEHGPLRIEVSFKDPMEDAVKVIIRAGGTEAKMKKTAG